MRLIIIYGSCYGTSKRYAKALGEKNGIETVEYSKLDKRETYDTVIYVGGLYAGGVWGLSKALKGLSISSDGRMLIATVGLADPEDIANIKNIRDSLSKIIPENICGKVEFYHLRGGMDYQALNLKHRLMMKLLYSQLKKTPEKERSAEIKAMLETYNTKVDFVNLDSLSGIINSLNL